MEMEMKRIAKQVSMIKKDEKFLSQLIPDVKGWKEQFTSDDLHKVYDAVQTKMDGWKFLPTDTKFDKLMFEVEWVTKAKKYPTWNVAASAYQKQLEAVQVIIQKKSINESIQDALLYSKTTKSTHLKKLVEQYSQMLAKGTDNVSELLNQSGKINAKYEALLKDKATRVAKKAGKNTIIHNPDAFSQERKDAALWAKSPKAADKKMRNVCGKVWREASEKERDAAFFYTHTFSSINEPLRGITYCGEKSLSVARGHVPHLTSIINKSKYDFDLWLQRGVDDGRNMLKVYLDGMTESEVKDMFLGTVIQDEGFISCGNSKGKGFAHRSVIFNIYCPKGTKGLYLEPFSEFGMGAKRSWDGISAQDYFGDEAEMLLQRGTKFRITKIEKAASKWYIDMEVVEQPI